VRPQRIAGLRLGSETCLGGPFPRRQGLQSQPFGDRECLQCAAPWSPTKAMAVSSVAKSVQLPQRPRCSDNRIRSRAPRSCSGDQG
jgi:hypothetical protein